MAKRPYLRYSQQVRDEAFTLWVGGMSKGEIRARLGIGDSTGLARIAKEDGWTMKRKILELKSSLLTAERTVVPDKNNGHNGEGTGASSLTTGFHDIAGRRAEASSTAHEFADKMLTFVIGAESKDPRSVREAYDLWKDSISFELRLSGITLEESFILSVFDVLRDTVEDPHLLRLISDRLRLVVTEKKSKEQF